MINFAAHGIKLPGLRKVIKLIEKNKALKEIERELKNSIEYFDGKSKTFPEIYNEIIHNVTKKKPSTFRGNTYLGLVERPSKNISLAERAGIPKGERNLPIRNGITQGHKLNYENAYSDISYPGFYNEITNPTGVLTAPEKYANQKSKSIGRELIRRGKAKDNDEVITMFKDYAKLQGAPEKFTVNLGDVMYTPDIIGDFRTYLNKNGYRGSDLTDDEISKIISGLYKELTTQMSGKAKGKVMWHGSRNWFDLFDWLHNLGSYTGNTGFGGPGNNFSITRALYGFDKILKNPVNIQPYLINNVESVPSNIIGRKLGFIPAYGYINNSEVTKNAILNTPEDYKLIWTQEGAPVGGTLNGPAHEEFTWRRNDNIKSLFPHPSLLKRNNDGSISINRNWKDPRVNYSILLPILGGLTTGTLLINDD